MYIYTYKYNQDWIAKWNGSSVLSGIILTLSYLTQLNKRNWFLSEELEEPYSFSHWII